MPYTAAVIPYHIMAAVFGLFMAMAGGQPTATKRKVFTNISGTRRADLRLKLNRKDVLRDWEAILIRATAITIAIFAISYPCASQADTSEFDRYMQLARNADSRDEKVEYLQKALKERPDDPENMSIEFEIATQLGQTMDPAKGETIHPRKALVVYQSILDNYDYMYYYDPQYSDVSSKDQYRMVQAAIQAGCIYTFILKDGEKGRKYQHLAMEMLKQTHDKRKADWESESRPIPPAALEEGGPVVGYSDRERDIAAYPYRLKAWEERKELASLGKVLDDSEMNNARIAVKHFGSSYGRTTPENVPVAMNQIIKEFPGTPMAQFAQDHIDRAMKMVNENLYKSLPESMDVQTSSPWIAEVPDGDVAVLSETGGASRRSLEEDRPDSSDANDGQFYWITGIAGAAIVTAIAVLYGWKRSRRPGQGMTGERFPHDR